jgi:hypothetical protein
LIQNGATSWPHEDRLPAGRRIELEPHHHGPVVGDESASHVIPAASRDLGGMRAGAPNLDNGGETLNLRGGARRGGR